MVGELMMYYDGHMPFAEAVLIVDTRDHWTGDDILVMTDQGQFWVDEDCLVSMSEWEEINADR